MCNWGILSEQTIDYSKMKECLKLASYLCDNLLLFKDSDEIRQYVTKL